jgi:hypothetical protein
MGSPPARNPSCSAMLPHTQAAAEATGRSLARPGLFCIEATEALLQGGKEVCAWAALAASRVPPLSSQGQLNAFLAQKHLSEPLMISEPEITV